MVLYYKFVSLLVKEFFKISEHLAKLWTKWLFHAPHSPWFTLRVFLNDAELARRTETVTNCCYVNRQIHLTLLSTDIKLLKTRFDLLTDRLMPCTAFCCDVFFPCCISCVHAVVRVIFNMAHVSIFLLGDWILLISPDTCFETVFEWQSLTRHFAALTPRAWRFLNLYISQGTVATWSRRGEIFKHDFIANLLLSLTVKEFWKSVNIWPFGEVTDKTVAMFFWLTMYTACVRWYSIPGELPIHVQKSRSKARRFKSENVTDSIESVTFPANAVDKNKHSQ